MHTPWDYLIVTASSRMQAAAYEAQLDLRQRLGFLAGARHVLVVPDPAGQRVGLGGSTLICLLQVLRKAAFHQPIGADPASWSELLRPLRILIVHAGGDSRRLPAYAPGGKIFVPLPGESDSALPPTLFDRQLPAYLGLPPLDADEPRGQIVVTAGDVLLTFDPGQVRFAPAGLTGLGHHAVPEQASGHGVYCPVPGVSAAEACPVRLYLQKPSPAEQHAQGAVDRYGQSILDIGVLAFDADTAATLLAGCGVAPDADGQLAFAGDVGHAIATHGLDIYREICCALGRDATPEHHAASAAASGSRWAPSLLRRLFDAIHGIPFAVQSLPHCGFLHFGTTRQILASGVELLQADHGVARVGPTLKINNLQGGAARIAAKAAWIEGCRVHAALTLEGDNVIVGADIDRPTVVPAGGCLDVVPGRGRDGAAVHFVRWYHVDDAFKGGADATFAGVPLTTWLRRVGAAAGDVWPAGTAEPSLWNARVFPAAGDPAQAADWQWMLDPAAATDAQRRRWTEAQRYSCAEIALLADHVAFHDRRVRIRAAWIQNSLRRMLRPQSDFSARELAAVLAHAARPADVVAECLREIVRLRAEGAAAQEGLAACRLLHTLATALLELSKATGHATLDALLPGLHEALTPAQRSALADLDVLPAADAPARDWCERLREEAFLTLSRTIITSSQPRLKQVRHALRADEIVWGRSPVRLDLGGGWTDTPPYSLEHGGCVVNAAVNLNAQPPIHCYARVIPEPVIWLSSIDLGTRVEIRSMDELFDFNSPVSEFALAKAAMALSGFSPATGPWSPADSLQTVLERFGGGIELTTLAAVPKGSGLGTSSIVGAVILSVLWRVMGRQLTRQELFNGVLRLEQALTTGGGWQDQIGGAVEGAKMITTAPGPVPDATIHYLRGDVLDPRLNGGVTLLYYTGVTRLAKNILQNVVGRYLDRDRQTLSTLRRIHAMPPLLADAMARKDLAAFGRLVDRSWSLNKELDPASTTEQIDQMLHSIRRHIHGAKLLGAGGGGFLLIVCKSPQDAATVRWLLADNPPNPRARFFDFSFSTEGLAVTVS